MNFIYNWLIIIPWALFAGYWGFTALQTNRTKKAEAKFSRFIHLGIILLAVSLLAVKSLGIIFLAWNIFPQSNLIKIAGLILIFAGLLFSIWARAHLGRYWSGTVTIKVDHQLIRTGPYAWVRHPIYTGLLIGICGTVLFINALGGLPAIVLFFIAYFRKIRIEENWLITQFGEEYIRYQQEVKALIPFLI